MIFVTLGTQDKQFIRLLQEIDKLIELKVIQDTVIVQAGFTKYESKYMQLFDFISMDDFSTYLRDCSFVISHGGVGSILTGLQLQKKIIAVARLEQFEEHENDHQVEIVSRFNDLEYIIGCLEVSQLQDALRQLHTFEANRYESNNENFCNMIQEKIDSFF